MSAAENGSEVCILIVAAGRGSRFGGEIPKQYRLLAGRPVLARTIEAFADALPDAGIAVAIHPDDQALYEEAIGGVATPARKNLRPPVFGGATRQDSVRNGLEALSDENRKIVLIHDAARPFATETLIGSAVEAGRTRGAAVPGFAVTDTIKSIDRDGFVAGTPDRANLRAVQTPQAFDFDLILAAHRKAKGLELTDDAAVAEYAGHKVHVFDGDPANMKITTADDLAAAERRIAAPLTDIRVGMGYDVHAFEAGDKVWLGGVAIPHDRKLEGHSDADVLMHAVTDALLGALADGDIGSHFPPSDPQWKGAASAIFLAYAADLVRARGGMIAHVDGTIVAERPKVGPHREAIRAKLAEVMKVPVNRIAIKATTSERLGFTGREEGMVAMATATIRLPEDA